MTPFLKERIDVLDVQNVLSHINRESARLLELHEKALRSSGDAEMQFLIDMSGFEIYLTNFCQDFRAKFL
jgi:hypothetical protein